MPEGSSASPATFARWRETSNKVTGRIATRPRRNPSAFSLQPNPREVTMPAPVTTTRAGGLELCLGGKSTVGLAVSQKLNEVFRFKSNAAHPLVVRCGERRLPAAEPWMTSLLAPRDAMTISKLQRQAGCSRGRLESRHSGMHPLNTASVFKVVSHAAVA